MSVTSAAQHGLRPKPFNGKRRLVNAVDVRFTRSLSVQTFDAGDLIVRPGDRLVVDTRKGQMVGRVVALPQRRVLPARDVQRVIRKASKDDLVRWERCQELAESAMRDAVRLARSQRLRAKIVQAEYELEQSRLLLFYSSEHSEDLRGFARNLARKVKARVDLRQVGVRDGSGIIGGLGPCGGELCCSSFLKKFSSISIRLAKDQGISLNPQKITGMCGRLKCCLAYEQPVYKEMRKLAPKRRKGVLTPAGLANILEVDVLSRKVRVSHGTGEMRTWHLRDVIVKGDAFTLKELMAGVSREDAVLTKRRMRRGGSQDLAGSPAEKTALESEGYLWADLESSPTKDTVLLGDETAKPKRRRRKRMKSEAGTSAGAKAAQQNTAEAAGDTGNGQPQAQKKAGDQPGKAKPSRRRRRLKKDEGTSTRSTRAENAPKSEPPKNVTPSEAGAAKASGEALGASKKGKKPSNSETASKRRRRRRKRPSKAGGQAPSGGGQSGGSES